MSGPEPYYEDRDAGIVIYNADCLAVLPLLGPVDHVITDPPYARDIYQRIPAGGLRNHQYSSASIEKLAVGDIGFIDEMIDPLSIEFARLAQRWALVFSDAESTYRWRQQLELAGMRYVRTGAWVKTDPMPQFSGDRPSVGFEPCTITHAQGPMRWNGGGLPAVWRYGTVKTDRPDHPCPKPLPLMWKLIEQFTDPGETILDPFGGSMTTALACKQLGRRCISIERSEAYCRVGVERLTIGTRAARAIDAGQAALL